MAENIPALSDDDLMQCCSCFEAVENPRSLFCLHIICYKCLNELCSDKQPNDVVICPTCRTSCSIPASGVNGFPLSFFIQRLAYKKAAKSLIVDHLCAGCAVNGEPTKPTSYCCKCHKKLCRKCARQQCEKDGTHQVNDLNVVDDLENQQRPEMDCDEHENQKIVLYCIDCKRNICLLCRAVRHAQHTCEELEKAADKLKTVMGDDLKLVSDRIELFVKQQQQLESSRDDSLVNLEAVEKAAHDRLKDIEAYIARQHNKLEQQCVSVKKEAREKARETEEQIKFSLIAMKGFCNFTKKLVQTGQSFDITRAAYDVQQRAQSILETYSVPDDYERVIYKFVPTDFYEMLTSSQADLNFIGRLLKEGDVQPLTVDVTEDFAASLEAARTKYQQEKRENDEYKTNLEVLQKENERLVEAERQLNARVKELTDMQARMNQPSGW